jgi:hypothetical protein
MAGGAGGRSRVVVRPATDEEQREAVMAAARRLKRATHADAEAAVLMMLQQTRANWGKWEGSVYWAKTAQAARLARYRRAGFTVELMFFACTVAIAVAWWCSR